jgi:hypothetical protein
MEAVRETRNDPVPLHLRNAVTGLMRGLGYGRDYRYSHDYADDDPRRWTQQYLPENVANRRFYEPGPQGFESREIAPRLADIRSLAEDGVETQPGVDSAPVAAASLTHGEKTPGAVVHGVEPSDTPDAVEPSDTPDGVEPSDTPSTEWKSPPSRRADTPEHTAGEQR